MAAPGAVTGCGEPENTLRGSISEVFSLEFDSVRARKLNLDLILEYLRQTDAGSEKPARLLVNTDGLDLKPGALVKEAEFLAHVQLTRVALDNESFPEMQYGELELEEYEFKAGGDLKGEFYVLFVEGHTLRGLFDVQIQEVVVE